MLHDRQTDGQRDNSDSEVNLAVKKMVFLKKGWKVLVWLDIGIGWYWSVWINWGWYELVWDGIGWNGLVWVGTGWYR